MQEPCSGIKGAGAKSSSRPIIVKSVNYNVFIVENAARTAVRCPVGIESAPKGRFGSVDSSRTMLDDPERLNGFVRESLT